MANATTTRVDSDLDAQSPAADLVRVYLNGIGKTALLNAADEVELAKRIEAGLYARHLLDTRKRLGENRKRDLAAVVRDGEAARAICWRQTFDWCVAGEALHRSRHAVAGPDPGGQSRADPRDGEVRLQQGLQVLHLCHVVDPSGDHPRHGRPEPHHPAAGPSRRAGEQLARIKREMHQNLGREATDEELAAESGIPVDKITDLLEHSRDPVSLDMPVGSDEEAPLGDFIEDAEAMSAENAVISELLHTDIRHVLATLDEREQQVIRLRFGLDDGQPRTLDQIGKLFGLSRERVRQIEREVMAKLRNGERADRLRSYAS